jgi:hypothetical protein
MAAEEGVTTELADPRLVATPKQKEKARYVPPPPVETIGDVTERDVEIWRSKYGDDLIAVIDVDSDPVMREKYRKQDTFVYVMDGLMEGLERTDIAIDEAPALTGLYYHNVSAGVPHLEYEPNMAFVTIPEGSLVTYDVEKELKRVFNMSDDEIHALKKQVNATRAGPGAEASIPVHIFKSPTRGVDRVHVIRDSVSSTTIYALGMVMSPAMAIARTASIIKQVAKSLGARIRKEELTRTKNRAFVRVAWFDHANGEVAFFATLDRDKDTDEASEAREREMAQAIANLKLTVPGSAVENIA